MFKKVEFSPSQPRRAKTRLFHGQGLNYLLCPAGRHPCLVCGAYAAVREYVKSPRTPLVAFFNFPS